MVSMTPFSLLLVCPRMWPRGARNYPKPANISQGGKEKPAGKSATCQRVRVRQPACEASALPTELILRGRQVRPRTGRSGTRDLDGSHDGVVAFLGLPHPVVGISLGDEVVRARADARRYRDRRRARIRRPG